MQYKYFIYSIGIDDQEYTDELHSSFPVERLVYNSIVLPETENMPQRTVYDIELI